MADGVTFPVPLPADLDAAHMVFIPDSSSSATHCPGIGQAELGYLCIYEVSHGNSVFNNAFDPTTGFDGISKYGFSIYLSFAGAGSAWAYGQWDVAAPIGSLSKNAAHASASAHRNP
jgi:hypothetical protein